MIDLKRSLRKEKTFKASITHYLGCLEEYVHFTERGFYRQREYGDTTKKSKQF